MAEYKIETHTSGFMSWWSNAYRGDELIAVQQHTPYLTRWGAIRGMKKHLRKRYGPTPDAKTRAVSYHV